MNFLGKRQTMALAAILLAVSAVLSRLMGLVRDKVISWQFGAGNEADMYFAAFVIPDMINYLLAGGFMSITIIPLLAQCFGEDEKEAWRFFSCVLWWMAIGSSLLTLAAIIYAPHLATLVAPGFSSDQSARLAFFMRIILPAQIFFLCGSCFTALLFLRRQFSVPALTPLIYNGGILAFGLLLPLCIEEAPEHFGMTGYCIGVTFGAFLGAFALPVWVALKGGLRLQAVLRHHLLPKFIFIALPLMLGQTVVMLDEQFLRVFGSMAGEGWVSILNYGKRIAQVPVGLVGQAAAVASYPFLVRLLAEKRFDDFDETLRKAILGAIALIIPCALLMTAACQEILEVIFQGGKFGAPETFAALLPARIMLVSTPFWIVYMVLVRGYYAFGDTLTPALTGTIITAICLPIYYFLAVPLGAWAIPALSGIAVLCYVAWLARIWKRRHGAGAFKNFWPICIKSVVISLPAAIFARVVIHCARLFVPASSALASCLFLALGCLAFSLLWLPLAKYLLPDIYTALVSRCAKLLGRMKHKASL